MVSRGLQLLLVVAGLAVLVHCQSDDLPKDCGDCEQDKCPALGDCPAGKSFDRCQCCRTCSKGLYELCEHPDSLKRPNVHYGVCGNKLECRVRSDIPDNEGQEAICYCLQEDTVCGTNGVTYDNICQLDAARNMGDKSVRKEKDGPCTTPPKIVTGPENVKNKTGSGITMSCEVKGFPIPVVEWTWTRVDGKVILLPTDDADMSIITRGGPEKYEVTGSMMIQKLRKEHEGDYTCVANNNAGPNGNVATDKAKARINVIVDKDNGRKSNGKKRNQGSNDL